MKIQNYEELIAHLMHDRFHEKANYEELIADHNSLVNEIYDFLDKNYNDAEEELESWGIEKDNFFLEAKKTQEPKFNINEVENKLGLKLPPSYINAVENLGILSLCNEYKEQYTMEDIYSYGLGKLSDKYDFGSDSADKYSQVLEVADKLIVFAKGDEQLQDCFHVCFNYHSLNKETGEVDIFFFDQSDWPHLLACVNSGESQTNSIYSYFIKASKEILEPLMNGVEGFFENE